MSNKTSGVTTWHVSTADRRPLRKHSKLGPPDLHPQEPRQEEDNLSNPRLSRGYQFATTQFEHESLVFNSRSVKLERLDDCLPKSAGLVALTFIKRGDINATLDKERRKSKDNSSAQFSTPQPGIGKVKERAAWFTDLTRGKPLGALAKRVPMFNKRKEEYLDYLCDYKIPSYRALWFLKISATLSFNAQGKPKKSTPDSFSADYRSMFNVAIADLMSKMWTIDDLTTSPIYKDRWIYVTTLVRRAFDDGVIEKQEFLNELCETFSDFYIRGRHNGDAHCGEEKPALLRVFLLLLSQFIKYINLNLILARRTAHMLAMKLRLIKMDFDERKAVDPLLESVKPTTSDSLDETTQPGGWSPSSSVYHTLVQCNSHRSNIYLLSALLHNIIIEAPASVIWNKFKVTTDRMPFIMSQLCASPLDLLPCPIYELPIPPGKESERFVEILKLRNSEIVRRSQAVQDRWAFNQKEQFMFAKEIDHCIHVVGALDSADVLHPEVITHLLTDLFHFTAENWDEQVVSRIKLMLHWAVTTERDGSYRPCLIAQVLRKQVDRQQSMNFGKFTIHDIVLQYFETESTRVGSTFYSVEFGSTIALFLELIRQKLFNHDSFVKFMITNAECNYLRPIISQYIKQEDTATDRDQPQFEDLTPDEPPPPGGLILPEPESKDEHLLVSEPANMWYKHRILIQVPLPQTEEYRSEANQRAMVLYGMGDGRETHRNELKKVAREICKIWQKRIYVQFYNDSDRVWCPRRYTAQKVQETLSKFKAQTYYDQVVICGWCAESFSDMIRDFVGGHSLQMPTSDGLDILCSMFESAEYVFGIFELCEAILPLLSLVEKVVRSLAADCIPGSLAGQLGYVFVSYLSKHWHFYLHSGKAPAITNMLYELIERMIRARDYPATSWGRTIAAFAYHSKVQLKKSKLTTVKIHGAHSEFRNVFNQGNSSTNGNTRYNSLFFKDILEDESRMLRFFSYHEYKKRLPSFDLLHNRYSFVINALIAAKNCQRDFDRLAEMSAFCGHISAQIPALADEWVCAIKSLCCSSVSNHLGYGELLMETNISDCSTHYPLATFVMLLAGKYAFSVPRLVAELLNNVFPPVMKKDQGWGASASMKDHDCEPGVCLALQILANIGCKTDEPFLLSQHYKGMSEKVKLLPTSADENIISMIHWSEMDNVIFPMLSNICILQDTLRNRHKDLELELYRIVDSTMYRKEYLMIIVKTVLTHICEQDWVTMKMYRIAETNNMEAFNHDRLKQNCLGQQLLRLGIRRKCERETVRELTVCNGNSKKALIDKLLSVMNLWNFRATYFDLMLMIKEISPEGAQKHQQQGAIAADALMGEIGKCCRDLFTNAHKDGISPPQAVLGDKFRFANITNYWLIAPLVRICPEPANVPASFHCMTVSGKFLKEAASMLDTANDSSRERIQQSAWLLSQQSFLNLVLSCMRCEKNKGSKDNKDLLVQSLYKQLQDLTLKTKENPALPVMEKFSAEREGLLLRLSLVGCVFQQICNPAHSDSWALLFFQIMLHGVLSPDKDRILYDSCFDMLSTLMLWTLVDPNNQSSTSADSNETKYRWPQYTPIIKKLRKEIAEHRVPSELRHLHQFLPIPKNTLDVLAVEPYGAPTPPVQPKFQGLKSAQVPSSTGIRHGRIALQPSEKVKVSSYDFVASFVPDQNVKGGWKWSMFQAAKVDRIPCPIQRYLGRIMQHKHPIDCTRPPMCVPEASSQDVFLSAPAVDICELVTSAPPSSTSQTPTTVTAISTSSPMSDVMNMSTDSASSTASTPLKAVGRKDDYEYQSADISSGMISSASGTPTVEMIRASTTPDMLRTANTSSTSASPKSRGGSRKRGTNTTRQAGQNKQKRAASRTEHAPMLSAPQYTQPSWQPPLGPGPPLPSYPTSSQQQPHMQPVMSAGSQAICNEQSLSSKEVVHNFITKRMGERQEQQLSSGQVPGLEFQSNQTVQPSSFAPSANPAAMGHMQPSQPNQTGSQRQTTLSNPGMAPHPFQQQQQPGSNVVSMSDAMSSQGGPPLLSYQGQIPQQPRNTMGQFATRDGPGNASRPGGVTQQANVVSSSYGVASMYSRPTMAGGPSSGDQSHLQQGRVPQGGLSAGTMPMTSHVAAHHAGLGSGGQIHLNQPFRGGADKSGPMAQAGIASGGSFGSQSGGVGYGSHAQGGGLAYSNQLGGPLPTGTQPTVMGNQYAQQQSQKSGQFMSEQDRMLNKQQFGSDQFGQGQFNQH